MNALSDLGVWLLLALAGLVVGTLGTIIGAGGGFLLVPLLLLVYPQESVKTITAISLAVVFLNAASGSLAYARQKRIDYRSGVVFALAGSPGSVVGALVTELVPRGVFDAVFGLLLAGLAIFLLVRGRAPAGHAAPRQVDLRLGAVLSFGVGFLSSILGIGGGIVHVPLLVTLLNYPPHIATATSHFILAIMTLVATITHLATGGLAAGGGRRILAIGVGVLVGAQLGARLSQRMQGRWLLRALGAGLLVVSLRLLLEALSD